MNKRSAFCLACEGLRSSSDQGPYRNSCIKATKDVIFLIFLYFLAPGEAVLAADLIALLLDMCQEALLAGIVLISFSMIVCQVLSEEDIAEQSHVVASVKDEYGL